MRPAFSLPALVVAAALTAPCALAQTAPASPPATPPPPAEQMDAASAAAPAPVPVGEDWNPVSRSATKVYLVDVNSIKVTGDVTAVNLARVPLHPANAADRSFTSVEMEFHCAAKESRTVAETDHGDDGMALDRSDTDDTFATFNAGALDAFISSIVCDDNRAVPPTFPSIAAFIEAGRPGAS